MSALHPSTRRGARALALLAVGGAAAAARPAAAGGILLYEVGSADVGLASAGYGARAQDASTVLTNPAGMTRLRGTQVLVGLQALYADLAFSPDPGTSPELGQGSGGNPVGWFPGGGLYVTWAASERLTLGLAAAGNFGLALGYDPGWVGRYYVQDATLIGVSFLPSAAWRVSDQVSVGASLVAMYGDLRQKVAINTVTGGDGQLALDDTTWGFGANVGVLWEPGPRTRLGLTYSSPVRLDFSAPAHFSGLTPALEALLAARGLTGATVKLGITVPQGLMASAYHELDQRWALLASVGWQQWSQFGMVEVGISDTGDPSSLTKDLHFQDTWHLAVGAQLRPAPAWRVDAGVAYDSSFQKTSDVSPMLPVGEAWRLGAGVHHAASPRVGWGLSAEYAYGGTLGVDRQSSLPPALGGRGNLSGSYRDAGILFMAASLDWSP